MKIWWQVLVSVAFVSGLSLAGLTTLALNERWAKRLTLVLVSFAVGALFGDAFIHLLPESYEHFTSPLRVAGLVLAGMFAFFALEKVLRWRHCHDSECELHMGERATAATGALHPATKLLLLADGVHNFLDGAVIAAAWAMDPKVGLATTVAVVLHEIPQEFGDFAVLVYGGLSPRRAVGYNFLSALTAFVGAVAVLLAGDWQAGVTPVLIPLTAGGFIYIAGADLVPELQHEAGLSKAAAQVVAAAAGATLMFALAFLE